MGADVEKGPMLTVEISDDNRAPQQIQRAEIPGARQFGFQSDQMPSGKEQPLDFERMCSGE